MPKKRTIIIIVIILGSILLVGPIGFNPVILFVAMVLCIAIGKRGDRVAVRVIQRGQITITEIREKRKPSKPLPEKKPDPIVTGHFREPVDHNAPTVPFEPVPTQDEEEIEPPVLDNPVFVIGTTEDGRTVSLDEISSLGVGGVQGSGKTVSTVGLCTQAVVKYRGNVRFVVVDPHMLTGSDNALSARMSPLAPFYLNVENLPNPVYGGADLVKWITWLTQQAKDRLSGRVPKEERYKIVVVADEFTALMDDPEIGPLLTALLLLINEQARKVDIFAVCTSPTWKSSRLQGTDVRNTVAAWLVHTMPPNIARQLIPYAEAEKSNRLAKGQAIFSSFGTVETVRVPFRTPENILETVEPYLPILEASSTVEETPETPVYGRGGEVEPGIAEVKAIWQTYKMLNRELDYDEENVIRALAIHFNISMERVRLALKLGEEHL